LAFVARLIGGRDDVFIPTTTTWLPTGCREPSWFMMPVE
jgi:hypothetical protein